MIDARTFAWVTGLHWSGVVCYVLVTILTMAAVFFDRHQWERPVPIILTTGIIAHGAGILVWWNAVGHGPYLNRFEVLSANAWVLVAAYLLFHSKYPRIKPVRVFIFPAAFFQLAIGLFLRPEMRYLPPTFRSVWLVIHIILYKIAFAALVIAFAFSVSLIIPARKKTGRTMLFSLSPDEVDLMAYRFSGFGFVFWAFGMLAGSIWAYQSWNIFWNWDPVQTWSLITWLAFGLYLHVRRFFGWRRKKAAWLFVVCFLLAVSSLFLTPFLESSIHAEYFK
jgi:ABC-type transport system involved in cytochrome c biogenesis permease subunit